MRFHLLGRRPHTHGRTEYCVQHDRVSGRMFIDAEHDQKCDLCRFTMDFINTASTKSRNKTSPHAGRIESGNQHRTYPQSSKLHRNAGKNSLYLVRCFGWLLEKSPCRCKTLDRATWGWNPAGKFGFDSCTDLV